MRQTVVKIIKKRLAEKGIDIKSENGRRTYRQIKRNYTKGNWENK